MSTATIAAAVAQARELKPRLPLFLGGHSFGGRMASHAVLDHDLGDVRGLVFCSFPLHPAGTTGDGARRSPRFDRGADAVSVAERAMRWRNPSCCEGVIERLGARAELVWLDTADHGYKVLKRSRTRSDSVFEELADAAARFVNRLC